MKSYPACKELFLYFLFQYILRAATIMVTVGDMVQIRMTTPVVVVKVSEGGQSCINILSIIPKEIQNVIEKSAY